MSRLLLLLLAVLVSGVAHAQTPDQTGAAPPDSLGAEAYPADAADSVLVAPPGPPAEAAPTPVYVVTDRKEPALGYLFGYLVPGGGHFYAGEHETGALMLVGVVGGYALAYTGALASVDCYSDCSSKASVIIGGLAIAVVSSIYSIFDGGQAVRRANARAAAEAAAPRASVALGAGAQTVAMRVRF